MPWNGSGVFARIYSWAADRDAGLDILADRMDTDTNDIAQGLMHCLTINGETVPTANLPLNNFRFTGASSGVANTDFVTLGQLKNGGGGLSGGFLPLSGGTLTGALIVQDNANPNITLNNTAAGPIFGMWAGGGRLNFGISNASGVPQTNLANLDGSGNLFTAGTLTATTLTATANRLIASGGASPSVTLVNTGGGGPFCMYNASSNLQWGTASSAGTPTASLMRLDGSGNLTAGGGFFGAQLNIGGGTVTAGAINASGRVNCTGNNLILQGGSAPTIAIFNTGGGGPFGICNANGLLEFGTTDGNGNLTSSLAYINTSGDIWADGRVRAVADATIMGVNGITYFHGGNQIGFTWAGSPSTIWAYVDANLIGALQFAPSDERLKSNIVPANRDALAALRAVELYAFDREHPLGGDPRHFEIGFIAQQLRKVIPEAVHELDGGAMLSLDLLPLTAYLARAVQQLDERLERLEGARG